MLDTGLISKILVVVRQECYDSSWLRVLYKVAALTGPALGNLSFFVPEVRYRGIAQCRFLAWVSAIYSLAFGWLSNPTISREMFLLFYIILEWFLIIILMETFPSKWWKQKGFATNIARKLEPFHHSCLRKVPLPNKVLLTLYQQLFYSCYISYL